MLYDNIDTAPNNIRVHDKKSKQYFLNNGKDVRDLESTLLLRIGESFKIREAQKVSIRSVTIIQDFRAGEDYKDSEGQSNGTI